MLATSPACERRHVSSRIGRPVPGRSVASGSVASRPSTSNEGIRNAISPRKPPKFVNTRAPPTVEPFRSSRGRCSPRQRTPPHRTPTIFGVVAACSCPVVFGLDPPALLRRVHRYRAGARRSRDRGAVEVLSMASVTSQLAILIGPESASTIAVHPDSHQDGDGRGRSIRGCRSVSRRHLGATVLCSPGYGLHRATGMRPSAVSVLSGAAIAASIGRSAANGCSADLSPRADRLNSEGALTRQKAPQPSTPAKPTPSSASADGNWAHRVRGHRWGSASRRSPSCGHDDSPFSICGSGLPTSERPHIDVDRRPSVPTSCSPRGSAEAQRPRSSSSLRCVPAAAGTFTMWWPAAAASACRAVSPPPAAAARSDTPASAWPQVYPTGSPQDGLHLQPHHDLRKPRIPGAIGGEHLTVYVGGKDRAVGRLRGETVRKKTAAADRLRRVAVFLLL